MNFLAYFAVLIASTLILRALAPKIRHPMPALEDFQVPTAEVGRPIPWLFGTRKIKDPNIIWYGDLDRHVQTKDGAKYYTYYMGLHLEICIGPVDAVYTFWYGDKVCWEGEATDSGLIQIEQPGLYGGQYKEGGIDGAFNLLFGKPTQPVNNYLEAQIGLPLSAFRDSFTIVARQPALVANATYIKPLMPLVKRIKKAWPDDTCWYPETAEIGTEFSVEYDAYVDALAIDNWWKLSEEFPALDAEGVNSGTNTTPARRYGTVQVGYDSLPEGTYDRASPRLPGRLEVSGFAVALSITDVTPFSLHAWFLIEDMSAASHIFATHVHVSEDLYAGLFVAVLEDGTVQASFGDGGGNSPWNRYTYTSAAGVIQADTRHFIVLNCSPDTTAADTELAVWIDGVLLEMTHTSGTATTTAWPSGKTLFFGGVHFHPAAAVNLLGRIDQVGHHSAYLTTENIELMQLYGTTPTRWLEADMNPAHIIYNVWVDTHQGMAEAVASIDADAMAYAADIFYAEQLGLSLYWTRQSKISDFIGEVCRHAGALQTINPRTGQLKIVALRDDYDAGTLDLLTEDDVIEVVDWQDAADGEAVNTITVQYVDRDGITQSVTYTNRAAVAQFGVIAETREYPGIAREDLALRIAKRDVKESSANLSKGKIKVNRVGWDKFPGDVFKFSHGPEGIDEIIVRVLEIDGGTLTDGAITLTVMQDVFSLPLTVQIAEQGGGWVAPDTAPIAATTQDAFEAPYWQLRGSLGVAETASLDEAAGYVVACAGKPNAVTTEYNIWTRINPAAYAETGTGHVTQPTGTLTAALDQQTTATIALTNPLAFAQIAVGWIARIGTGTTAEMARVTALDSDAYTVDIDRGVLDTTPQSHALGARVFFFDAAATEWPRDLVEHTAAETVLVKLQMASHAGEISIDDATPIAVALAARQIRPYPPGNIEINGEAHPTEIEGALTVTWAHRDRMVQGTTLVSQYDATDYGPEAGTTYNAYAYDDDTDALLDSDTGLSGTTWSPSISASCTLRLEIESVRDGYASWQRQVRIFGYISAGGLLLEDGNPWLAEDGNYQDQE